jgi:NAD(P)H-dependent FMN reductase
MKFLCLAYLDRGLAPGPSVAAEYGTLGAAMRKAGVFVDSGQLSPADAARLVRVAAGETEISDGPPPGTGPAPSAYFVLDCADLDDALAWAARIPTAVYGSIEVRPPPVRTRPGVIMLNLKIIIGSTRLGRAADRVTPWIVDRAKEHGAFGVDVLDLRDWPLPFFAETFATVGDPRNPAYSDPAVGRWNQRIAESNAYLFITPEYNHSVSAVLKNAIDSVFARFAFRNKPAAFVSYSGGIAAGVRAIEHLAHIAIEAEMVPLRSTVLVPVVDRAFGPDGTPADPAATTAAGIILDDLAWWAAALHQARHDHQLPPAALRKMAAHG